MVGHDNRQVVTGVRTYAAFRRHHTVARRLRAVARNVAISGLALGKSIAGEGGSIRFPYLHHVFDDERKQFEREITYLKRYGSFLSFTEAVALMRSTGPLEGSYFCLSFDDGFKNCLTNALPILAAHDVPCTFFVVTDYLGTTLSGFPNSLGLSVPVEFMTWEDCRQLRAAGMEIGSHTCSHATLQDLSRDVAIREMRVSKERIEQELGCPCAHFCAPRGMFSSDRDPELARQLGYTSFSTTNRGAMRLGESSYFIKRDAIVANDGVNQLRYFLSRE